MVRAFKNLAVAVLPHAVVGSALTIKRAVLARRKLPEYLDQIRTQFPELEFRDARILTRSFNNVAVVLDDKWIFRFPRDACRQAAFDREIALLSVLRLRTPVRLPDYRYLADENRFGGYRLMPGAELGASLFNAMTRAEQELALNQYAGFLNALHMLRPDCVGGNPMPLAANRDYFVGSYFERNRIHLVSKLDPNTLSSLDEFMESYATEENCPHRLIHCDVDDNHVLWDRDTRELAVIDFGNASVGDPALDFAFLFALPDWAVSHVIANYVFRFGDAGLSHRAFQHAVRRAYENMFDCFYHDGHPRKIADTIKLLQTRLSQWRDLNAGRSGNLASRVAAQ
jgi:aminoglycoside 2''-phosphotransferase